MRTAGFPACSHAPMIMLAVEVMDAASCFSITGFTPIRNFSSG